jgi:hypothetical protein
MFMNNGGSCMKMPPFSQNIIRFGKGMVIVQEKNKELIKEDTKYEGRDKAYLDIDRMINEGLSGGSVHIRQDGTNIEESHVLENEEPPYEAK